MRADGPSPPRNQAARANECAMTFFTMVHPRGLPGNRAFPGRYGPAAVDETFPGGPGLADAGLRRGRPRAPWVTFRGASHCLLGTDARAVRGELRGKRGQGSG